MKIKVLLFALFAISLFALGVLITTLFNTNPTSSDVLGLFYIALFVTLYGLVFYAMLIFAYLRHQAPAQISWVKSSLRLSGVVSLLMVGLLALQAQRLLNIATFLVLVVASVMLELMMRRRVFR